jgi:hypothetical protein
LTTLATHSLSFFQKILSLEVYRTTSCLFLSPLLKTHNF